MNLIRAILLISAALLPTVTTAESRPQFDDIPPLGVWQFESVNNGAVEVATVRITTAPSDVYEALLYVCTGGVECKWMLNLDLPCKEGESGLASLKEVGVTYKNAGDIPGTFLKCAGPNPMIRGAYAYLIGRYDAFDSHVRTGKVMRLTFGLDEKRRVITVIPFNGALAEFSKLSALRQ